MFIINKEQNKIEKVEATTFKKLGFREREHLQEWISKNPSCLNEELLIIQKEFSGFNDTNERLDLLALDKEGHLVIIENKLDDSGKDVTWQALKYASYCSTLNTVDIIKIYNEYLGDGTAEEKIEEFLESEDLINNLNQGASQRIMLVAGEFRKEVTSTVLWLLNFGIKLSCFKATPFKLENQLFLNIEQVIPMKETEDFIISMAQKNKDDIANKNELKNRHHVRISFWKSFLEEVNKKNNLFSSISPSKDNWCGIGIGLSGVNCNVVATKKYARAEIYFNRGSQAENKDVFDFTSTMKDEIHEKFGGQLQWERMDEKVSCRIKAQLDGVNMFDEADWPKMIAFLMDSSERMVEAFKNPIKKISTYTKSKVNA